MVTGYRKKKPQLYIGKIIENTDFQPVVKEAALYILLFSVQYKRGSKAGLVKEYCES